MNFNVRISRNLGRTQIILLQTRYCHTDPQAGRSIAPLAEGFISFHLLLSAHFDDHRSKHWAPVLYPISYMSL